MVKRDQCEGAESPKHEGVGEPGSGRSLNHFALQHDLPEELADARPERLDLKVGIGTRAADDDRTLCRIAARTGTPK